jgi:hypothetical protein
MAGAALTTRRPHLVASGRAAVAVGASRVPPEQALSDASSHPVGGAGDAAGHDSAAGHAQSPRNNVLGLTAVLIPGQTITSTSQAFAVAICAKVG